MIAIDTNLLVYAHREDSPWHETAHARLAELAEGRGPRAIPWPCLHEFLAVVTHPRIYNPPTPWKLPWSRLTPGWNPPAWCNWPRTRDTGRSCAPP